MKQYIVVAGHACLDITPAFADRTARPLGQVLQPGKLISMQGVTVSCGGCVSNTGLGLAKLGAPVRLLAKIGDDAFGTLLHRLYEGYGAADSLLTAPGERTSYSVVIAAPGVDRIFLHDAGANDTFATEDVPDSALRDAAIFHFGYPPLMRRIYQDCGTELEKLLTRVRQADVVTSLDLAMISPTSEAGHADWRAILARVLPLVDCFVPSVEELCLMLDPARYAEWEQRAAGGDMTAVLDPEADIRPVAQMALELGAGIVLLKCGAPGMYLCTSADTKKLAAVGRRLGQDGDAFAAAWAGQDHFEKSYRPDRVLSGTGAGDTSIAAFLKALNEGCPPKECQQLAAATGACCVAAYDAVSGLQTFDELRRRIAAGWPKSSADA